MSAYTKSNLNTSMIHAYSLKSEHFANVRDVIDFYKMIAQDASKRDEKRFEKRIMSAIASLAKVATNDDKERYAKSHLRRTELRQANQIIRQREYNLYYVVKNDIFVTNKLHKEQNLYDLTLLRSLRDTKQVETTEQVETKRLTDATVKAEKKSSKKAKAATVETQQAIESSDETQALNMLEDAKSNELVTLENIAAMSNDESSDENDEQSNVASA